MKVNFAVIVDAFEAIVGSNPLIRTFYFGDTQNLTQTDMLFPAAILTPLPGDLDLSDPGIVGIRFSLGVIDRLEADNSNLRYVIDDTMNLAIDILTVFGEREDINLTNSNYEVGFPTFDYACAGTSVSFTVQEQITNCGKMADLDLE